MLFAGERSDEIVQLELRNWKREEADQRKILAASERIDSETQLGLQGRFKLAPPLDIAASSPDSAHTEIQNSMKESSVAELDSVPVPGAPKPVTLAPSYPVNSGRFIILAFLAIIILFLVITALSLRC